MVWNFRAALPRLFSAAAGGAAEVRGRRDRREAPVAGHARRGDASSSSDSDVSSDEASDAEEEGSSSGRARRRRPPFMRRRGPRRPPCPSRCRGAATAPATRRARRAVACLRAVPGLAPAQRDARGAGVGGILERGAAVVWVYDL